MLAIQIDQVFSPAEIKEATILEAKEMVRHNLRVDNEWLVRALLALYKRQTSDEIVAEDTKHKNDRGFNSADAMMLTGFAKQWVDRRWFSDKQMFRLRQKLPKYAGQLVRIARGES